MNNDRDLLVVAVFTTLTVFLWIFFELIKTTKTSTVSQPLQQIVSPFTSNIDVDVLGQLESRKTFD